MEHVTTQGVWSCEVVQFWQRWKRPKDDDNIHCTLTFTAEPGHVSLSTLLSLTSEVSSLETQRSRALAHVGGAGANTR